MTNHHDRIKQMAQEAGFPSMTVGNLSQQDAERLSRFAQLVAEDCANTSPNGLDIMASASPAEVWRKFGDAIRARYS